MEHGHLFHYNYKHSIWMKLCRSVVSVLAVADEIYSIDYRAAKICIYCQSFVSHVVWHWLVSMCI